MGTWNALFCRGEVPADFRPDVEGPLEVRRVGEWTELALPGGEDGLEAAQALSRAVQGEVIWGLVQTTASVVSVVHCEGGRVVRQLSRSDGTWAEVEGEPRPWEAALFSAEALERAHDDVTPELIADIEARFRDRRLEVGARDPSLGEWETLFAALGVTGAQWNEAHRAPVRAEVEGGRTSRLTWLARGALGTGLVLALALLVLRSTRGPSDATGLLGLFSSLLLSAAFCAGALRKLTIGRWFA